ncbi:MAG: ABC transporter permease [Candidatus Nomurabacteria bacterium]|jgi:putative ABC transport system permease protein|nr:ABC transporter permease [Candidatus Nomurabacteria bacterium]
MFKNMFKRAWLSTTRKISRTVILVVVMFVMANMMLATIAIKASVTESVKYAKESLSGIVYLQPDMTAMREKMQQQMSSGSSADSFAATVMTRPTISVDMATTIADSEYIKDYTYGVQTSANASSYTPIETEEQQMRNEIKNNSNRPNMPDGGGQFQFSRGDTNIVGINSFAFISDVEAGNMKLGEGEIFDEDTVDGVMISADLATANSLAVGDTVKLKTTSDSLDEISLKIVGIYENTNDNYDTNAIYMNVDTAARFLPEEEYNDGNYNVENVKYYLTSAEYKDKFIAEAKEKYPTLEDDGLTLDIDDSAYQQMVGPIESVGSFATTIMIIVIVAAVVIITLIVTINVKDRRYEMGVLLSLGATKKNILGQILVELVFVGTVGFILSIGTSIFLAKAMGQSLLENQTAMTSQQTSQNFGRGQSAGNSPMPNMGGGGRFGGMQMPDSEQQNQVETIDEIDVNATPTDYVILFAAGYAIIIVSLILPTISILRYQPKTILSGKE